jgi:uncharacterized repeat protein (TIGR01451 family)
MAGLALLANMAPPVNAQSDADLRVLKYSSPTNEVQAGEQFTYTIIVDNLGPISATNVVITDTLVTSGPVDPNGCSIAVRTDGGAIDEFNCNFALSSGVFDLGTFGSNHLHPRSPDDMGRIIVTINATANEPTDMTNITTVTSDTPDPNMDNNVAVDTLSVTNTADLRLLKFSSPTSEVRAGEQFTYTILVDNLGPGVAENVVITDTLVTSGAVDPNGCSIAVRTGGGAFDEFDCEFEASTGVFDLGSFGSNHLNPRSPTDQGRIIVTINATANEPTDMTNVTTVTSATPDPDLDDNLVVTTLSVIGVSDMALNKTAVGQVQISGQPGGNYAEIEGQVSAGALLTYTLAITNQGPSKAENVLLSDPLPSTVSVIKVAASHGNCTAGQTVTCGLGTLPGGAGATVTVTVRPDAALAGGTVINNQATVESDYFDPDNGNSLHTAGVEVSETPDLWIAKVQTPETVYEGDITYRITAGNDGPSDAPFALISDTLPVAVTPLSWDCVAFNGASCPTSSFFDLWEVDLPAGGYVIISVHGTLTSAQPVVNVASIEMTSGNSGLYVNNNTASVMNILNAIYVPIAMH